jgi:hypothetical protein
MVISYSVFFLLYVLRPNCDQLINDDEKHIKSWRKTIKKIFSMRIYHYVSAITCVMIWRCLWDVVPNFWGEFNDIKC